jgi:hypothetical protein
LKELRKYSHGLAIFLAIFWANGLFSFYHQSYSMGLAIKENFFIIHGCD